MQCEVVKTERVVGGGDDGVNFCAKLKNQSRVPQVSIDRSGAAWDRTGRVGTPSSLSGKKLRDNKSRLAGKNKQSRSQQFSGQLWKQVLKGGASTQIQAVYATRNENEMVQLFEQNVEMRIHTGHFSKARTKEVGFFDSHVPGLFFQNYATY